MRRFSRPAVALAVLLTACAQPSDAPAVTLPDCLYLAAASGRQLAVPYASQSCARAGYAPLTGGPRDTAEVDAVESWAFNAHSAGIISALTEYGVRARLATLDERRAYGISVHAPLGWADHKWADHVTMAHAGLLDAIGDSRTRALLEAPLVRAGLGSGRGLDFAPPQRALSARDRRRLRTILARAEAALQQDARMRAVGRSLEEAVMERPDHAAARRRNLGAYGVK